MAYLHKNLTLEKWSQLDKAKQILNIASELTRAKNWYIDDNYQYMKNCLDRVLELIDLTSQDKKWSGGSLKELRRLREILGEYYLEQKPNNNFNLILTTLLQFDPQTAFVQI